MGWALGHGQAAGGKQRGNPALLLSILRKVCRVMDFTVSESKYNRREGSTTHPGSREPQQGGPKLSAPWTEMEGLAGHPRD